MEVRLQEAIDRSKSNSKRIEKLEHRADHIEELIKIVAVLAEKQNSMEMNIDEMKSDIKSMLGKPAKRFDAVIDKILLTVIAAVVSFVLIRMGLG
ncbi:MAG: hypothetical protein IJV88_04470 [Ruminococcus sp.]|nr:hypothetical protein [Ruminococcus sp.]